MKENISFSIDFGSASLGREYDKIVRSAVWEGHVVENPPEWLFLQQERPKKRAWLLKFDFVKGIKETGYHFPGQTGFYRGKVRDVYHFADRLVVVTTDRISAFDVVLPEAIPYKGQVLNQIAYQFLKATEDIVPNWAISQPDPSVTIGRKCMPFPVEMVVRGYLSGHAWREYKAGKREICGEPLPAGLNESDRLPFPIITPTTKAHEGHDEDISKQGILSKGLLSKAHYEALEQYSLALFERGSRVANERGLILVDTKYEFGLAENGEICLIDEVHTPDSSRYFYQDGYEDRQRSGEPQKQLSKEFVRQWLIENGFQGKDGQSVPVMDAARVNSISERYIELYEKVSSEKFVKRDYEHIAETIQNNILNAIKSI